MRRCARDGDEQAAVTEERKHLIWRPGERKRIRQQANRRDRRTARQHHKSGLEER